MAEFSTFLPRETTFVTSCVLYCTQISFWKGVYSIREEFAPSRVDRFSKGDNNNFDRIVFPGSVSIPRNNAHPIPDYGSFCVKWALNTMYLQT